MKKFFLLYVALLLISACFNEYNLEVDRKICTYSYLSPNLDTVAVLVAHTGTSLNNAFSEFNENLINDAEVKLLEDENFVATLNFTDSGFYTTPYRVSPGKKYDIVITYESEQLHGETVIPEFSPECSFRLYDVEFDSTGSIRTAEYKLDISISDKELSGQKYFIMYEPFGTVYETVYAFIDDDKIGYYENTDDLHPDFVLFTDDNINGTDHTFTVNCKIRLPNYIYFQNGEIYPFQKGDTVKQYLKIFILDDNLFNFYKSIELSHIAYKNGVYIESFPIDLKEPVAIYSNIENGYGVVGSYQVFVDTVKIVYK